MTVMCDRRASRLILSVGNPSKYTLPSVRMHRKRARVRELFTPMSVTAFLQIVRLTLPLPVRPTAYSFEQPAYAVLSL